MRKFVLITFTLLISFSTIPTFAIENGTSALGDQRAIHIYTNRMTDQGYKTWVGGCSAWLYSPRIVLTSAHCVHDDQIRPRVEALKPEDIRVGKPGVREDNQEILMEVVQVFTPKTFQWYVANVGGTLSFKDDFAALVLKSDLSEIKPAKLATKELLDSLVEKGALVSNVGYGFQSSDRSFNQHREPKYAKYSMITFSEGMKKVNEYKSKWSRNFFQEDAYFMRVDSKRGSPCDGDSGSGYYIEEKGVYTYLGPMHSPIGTSNCGMQTADSDAIATLLPVYVYSNYVTEAENYVKNNPSPSAQKDLKNLPRVIKCKKGSNIKKVFGKNPKCPAGFKLMKV